ncbi:hypothetical protein [Halorubrum kocurii]|uniref:Uncharacterized protein n=1 Tax=Halorubrum kocurii JCM 14978 TaxID=1230456 RepID=M0NQ85_9EURY|nr:hypothetical protein [Halorubrum kocurii]EMA59921.1 hypothetical protein C468_14053 [Halorubrum kocurii JCM 14978]
MTRASAIAIAAIVVVSMLAAPLGAATVGAQTSGPSGMVALGSDQVAEDVPDGESMPIGAGDLEGAIYASDHADTLEAVVTTPERADEKYIDSGTVVSNDKVALVLRDDEVHDGRKVAVEISLLEEAIGYAPEVAYGVHDSGEEWQSQIERDGEVGVFEVPEFSSNSVTFSGGITLSGDAAGDGTSYEYQLDNLDGVDDFAINTTGVENSETEEVSMRDTGEVDPGIGGNVDPPETEITLEGNGFGSRTVTDSATGVSDGYSTTVDLEGSLTDTDKSAAPTVDVTGVTNSEWDNVSASGVSNGDSIPLEVSGTTSPTGPSSNGEPTVTFTGVEKHTIDDVEDGDTTTLSSEWDGWSSGSGTTSATSTNVIDGSHSLEVSGSNELASATTTRSSDITDPLSVDVLIPQKTGDSGDSTTLQLRSSDATFLGALNFQDEGPVEFEGETVQSSWSTDTVYQVMFAPNFANDEVTIYINGESKGTFSLSNSASGHGYLRLERDSRGSGDTLSAVFDSMSTGRTDSPAIDIDGDGVNEASHSGVLEAGETATYELSSLSTDNDAGSVSLETGPVDIDVSMREHSQTRDPVVELNGETVEHTGSIPEGETETLTFPDGAVNPGESNTLSLSLRSTSGPSHEADLSYEFEELDGSLSPEVDTNGDGSAEVSSTDLLTDGETTTATIDPSIADTWNISATGNAPTVSAEVTERTKTSDPVVKVNGYETEHSGTLADGETTSLATNEAWVENGTNTVTINTNSPERGPESLVGFEYAHDASGTTQSVEVSATSWTERFNVSNTYPSAVSDANAVLTFDDSVAEIKEVEYRVDGGEWKAPPSHELNGTDLEVQLGDMGADTTVDVRATGHKIRTYDGAVEIVEPTVEGDELATEVEITNMTEDAMFGLRVDGTATGERVHYATEESWSGESAHVEITESGTQILRAPDANVGSIMTVRSSPISVEPNVGAVEVLMEDASEPRFSVRDGNTIGADQLDVTYYDTISGDRYALWSETNDVEVDAARAQSPVTFTASGSTETYSILQRDSSGTTEVAGPTDTRNTLPLVLAFGGIGVVLIGTALVGRRFGVGGRLLPITAASLSAIAIHVLAPGQSPFVRALELGYDPTGDAAGSLLEAALGSNVVAIVIAAVLLLGLWQVDQRTQGNVPLPVWAVVGILTGVWALETLSPGVILGGLREGISTMAPLLVAGGALGIAYFVRNWLRARREEASTPDTQVTLSGFDRGDD